MTAEMNEKNVIIIYIDNICITILVIKKNKYN